MKRYCLIIIALLSLGACQSSKSEMDRYIDSLLAQMTLEEKLGQMNLLIPPTNYVTGDVQNDNVEEKTRKGLVGGMFGHYEGVKKLKYFQDIAVKESRLGIPLIFGADVIHGHITSFPVPLGMAASWNHDLIRKASRVAAEEIAAKGVNWTYNPMVDISRDPRWGRCVEGAGEDPFLSSLYAKAVVEGFQGDLSDSTEILACVKHFAIYGAAEGGRDYRETDMSLARLYNEYLPPYKAAVDAGVASVMTSFNDINGTPAAANRWLHEELLRNQWGFDGFVVTDYTSVEECVAHGLGDIRTVTEAAVNAGMDMEMVSEGVIKYIAEAVAEGRVDEKKVDAACRRILEAKYKLGLFADPYKYLDGDESGIYTDEKRALAREVAAESFVLLKNDGVLPLSRKAKVALIGPMADAGAQYVGSWDGKARQDYPSLRDRMSANKDIDFLYARGSNLLEDAHHEKLMCRNRDYVRDPRSTETLIKEAVQVAKRADVIVAAVGEPAWMTGEASSRTALDMPQVQTRLLKALKATGKPVVMLLFSGRPMTLNWENANMDAILDVWYGGSEAADAIIDVIYGDKVPSGKITMTFPRSVGQVPIYYCMKNTGRPHEDKGYVRFKSAYTDCPNSPLYPFGYGLSYTTFEYSDFRLSAEEMTSADTLKAVVKVTNTGKYDAKEIVQLYIRDVYSSMTRPVKELKGFRKVFIPAGESVEVEFEITEDMLSWYYVDQYNMSGQSGPIRPVKSVEAGEFDVMLGPSSDKVMTLTLNYNL